GASATAIPIDITAQNDDEMGAVDFMVAQSAAVSYTIGGANDTAVAFTFEHMLSKVIFTITSTTDLTSLSSPKLVGINTLASYGLDGAIVASTLGTPGGVELTYDSSNKTLSAILHPGEVAGASLELLIGGTKYSADFSATLAPETIHTFELDLENDELKISQKSSIKSWNGEQGEDLTTDSATPWDGETVATTFNSETYGAAGDYEIATAAELAYLAKLVNDKNDGLYDFEGYTFTLVDDINMNGHPFNSIGDADYDKNIAAKNITFDGGGKRIYNLYATAASPLFNIIHGSSTIKNLTIEGEINAPDNNNVVPFVCENQGEALIENCHNRAKLTGDGTAAGIICHSYGKLTILGCTNSADISAKWGYVGGIIAKHAPSVRWSFDSALKISGCTNSGKASSTEHGSAAGILGYCESYYEVDNCTNSGDISIANTGYYTLSVGGIVGTTVLITNDQQGDLCPIISNCQNSGDISCSTKTEYITYIGGIVGGRNTSSQSSTICIINCSNSGAISDNVDQGSASDVTYLSAISPSATPYYLVNCYNTGKITSYATTNNIRGLAAPPGITYSCYNTGAISASSNDYAATIASLSAPSILNTVYYNSNMLSPNSESTKVTASTTGYMTSSAFTDELNAASAEFNQSYTILNADGEVIRACGWIQTSNLPYPKFNLGVDAQ
ncbi:MAG: fimbrillin family protein, partial [Rikenellaceae bacterium]